MVNFEILKYLLADFSEDRTGNFSTIVRSGGFIDDHDHGKSGIVSRDKSGKRGNMSVRGIAVRNSVIDLCCTRFSGNSIPFDPSRASCPSLNNFLEDGSQYRCRISRYYPHSGERISFGLISRIQDSSDNPRMNQNSLVGNDVDCLEHLDCCH